MLRRLSGNARTSVLFTIFALALVTVLLIVPGRFTSKAGSAKGLFVRTSAVDEALPNYDIRTSKDKGVADYMAAARSTTGKSAASVDRVREGFKSGEEQLRTRLPHVKFEYNEDIRIPEVITPDVWRSKVEFLTQPSGQKHSELLRGFLKENNQLVGADDSQIDSLIVAADYTNPDGNLSFVSLEQQINGIPVFRGEVKAGFTKDGRIIRVINNLAPGLDYSSLSTDFGDAATAVNFAAGNINHDLKPSDTMRNDAASTDTKVVFGDGDWATTAEKMYFPTEPGVAVPSWRVLIWEPVNAYYVMVDAKTGTVLWRKNITADQTQSETYNVYNNVNSFLLTADSPAPMSPGPVNPTLGTQGALGTRSNVTLIGNESPNTFNNSGWITDGGNTTDGNALEAGIDRDGTNGVDATQIGSPSRTFTSTWNPPPGSPAPGDDPLTTQAQRGAVIQMFYVMNRYHDALYRLGFTEAAHNFQNDNFGRGGTAGDRVSAEGQDSSGTNNANFSTPADGGRGRMQMYLWNGPTPDYDGTADAEVIIHEATHGTSNRLHGNGNGLASNMSGGLGEGWGDFYAYTMLAEPTDPINGIYTTGGYATYLGSAGYTGNYYYGIRRFPRAPITFVGPNGKPHNPFTFQYVNSNCNTLIGTTTSNPPPNSAFARGPFGSSTCDQVHNIGEIWSSMLWEVRNRMVARLGFAAGTTRVLQVVTDGMKLAPISPTLLQERDAILSAAAALPLAPEANADVADVRDGFRVRGAGFTASIQNTGSGSNNTAVTEAFDFANVILSTPFSVSDSVGNNNGIPEPGENVLLSIPVKNPSTGASIDNVQVNVNGGPNVSYGTIADGSTFTNQIPYTIPAISACGSLESVTINISSSVGVVSPASQSFRLGQLSFGGNSQAFDAVTAPALPTGFSNVRLSGTAIDWVTNATGPNSAPNSAFAVDPSSLSDAALTVGAKITSASAQLSFKNKYATESGFDGAVLEISTDGNTWTDVITAGGSFVSGGYNASISTGFSSPIGGRQAWTGASGGYLSTVINLPAALNGQTISLRWRMVSDISVGSTGINIDDIVLTGGQFGDSYSCAAPVAVKSRADFDGDGKTDVSVFRPSDGNWYQNNSTAGFTGTHWGQNGDVLVPGDYDGDGKADFTIWRPSDTPGIADFYLLKSNGFTISGMSLGITTDIPVPGDFDGDGKSDFAVYRLSGGSIYWFIYNSSTGLTSTLQFGAAGDVPFSMDNDGDGKANLAVFRPSNNTWFIARPTGLPSSNFDAIPFGIAGDVIVPADYDGDNKDDVAVFRPSTGVWFILKSSNGQVTSPQFGQFGDVAVPGDYDGDGKDDTAVYRNGIWYINGSTSGFAAQSFGLATDIPVPAKYHP